MKRIISGFLILLLLLPAGCKQQNTEPATPGTVVENQAPDAPEQDVPEVVQPEEAPAVEEVPEVTPSEPTEKEKKAARLEEALIQAEKVFAEREDIEGNDFVFRVYLVEYPEGGEFTSPMETIPDFSEIEYKEIVEYSYTSLKNKDPERIYTHTINIILKETSPEAVNNTVHKLMKRDDVYDVKFEWVAYYIACI